MSNSVQAERGLAEAETASPWRLPVLDVRDVMVGELAEHGEWIVANIETSATWPLKSQKVMYRGVAIWVLPVMRTALHPSGNAIFFPAVAMKIPRGKNRAECEKLVMRFISNLSWVEGAGFAVHSLFGGNLPRPLSGAKESGYVFCQDFDLAYFPEPTDPNALLALALMREGRSINNSAYAFLSFFRVLEVAFPNGRNREHWISASINSLRGHLVPEALSKLTANGVTDIGAHLYESGRCAVAHASRTPIVDPDDPADMRRMQSELPIICALAEKAIEDVLGVQTSTTVYREHLYELAGFKEILGADIVQHLVRGEQITDERMVTIPEISIRLRKHAPYSPLSNLSVKSIGQTGKIFHARFESPEGDVAIRFQLDFGAERLNFSPFNDLAYSDTGSANSAERVAELVRFQNELFGNGQLVIVDAETESLIARKDAYIPVNMYLDQEAADEAVAQWRRLAAERHERDKRYGEEVLRWFVPYAICVS